MIAFWSYKKEYKKLKKIILNSINSTILNGQIFFGKNLLNFEENFIKKNKSKYGLAVKSGTDALLISLISIGIKNGDEVITAANTAIPTISAIIASGAKPVLVDIKDDYLIDCEKLLSVISKKTKAIIPVHLYGKACNMSKLLSIANKKKIHIIEDCAQAQGAKHKNKHVGTFGSFGCFSFYPTKILGGYGDGGFITTNSYKLYTVAKKIRFYGIETEDEKNKFFNKYYANIHGISSRLDEINAKILDIKLRYVKNYIKRRREIANIYFSELKNTSLKLPVRTKDSYDVFHLFTVYHQNRDKIIKILDKKGVQSRILYPYPINKMAAYKNFFKSKNFKISSLKADGIFSLPLYPELKTNEVLKICRILKKILENI